MRTKPALTLVELLASLAIVTMLVVAALGVTTTLARSELAIRRQADRREGLGPAGEDLIRSDLLHAHHWRGAKDGFAVQTNARLTAGTFALEHVPSVVTYRVHKADERPCLVRVQETAPGPPVTELVAVGVRSVALAPEKDVRPNAYGWKALVDGCTVRLIFDEDGKVPRDLDVHVPREGPN